jgi:phosphoribosylaminoimidazole-succinocarboxamide synthase
MPITFEQAAASVGGDVMVKLRDKSIALYTAAADYALSRGIIIADTKFEWGLQANSVDPILIDEALTPDSSRFWPAAVYEPGRDQQSFDKQYVRDYLETLDWNKTPPGPELPGDVVANTRHKYAEAYHKITGKKFI